MAQGKKSFIAYSDWHGMFNALPDDIAGKLIKHIFAYVNDENPTTEDYVIKALFEQIKSTLKRDLKKWETQRQQRVDAGKRSAEARAMKSNDRSTTVNETERNSTVNGNVNVSVNDNVKVIKKNIEERKREFYNSLLPFVDVYGKEMLRDFYEYWSEHGVKDRKFRMEKEKSFNIELRLKTWKKRSKDFKSANEKPQSLADKMKQEYGL